MKWTPERSRDWVPIRFFDAEPEPLVEWCYMGDERFTQPFFDDTITRRMQLPFNTVFRHRTPISFLGEVVATGDLVKPTGFIFHMSRCGSTLIAQLLAALEKNIVISEAPAIDWVIGSGSNRVEEKRKEWLKWIVSAFGRRRFNAERHYFMKFDCWNTLDLDVITSVYPDVPFVFLYRDPVEVLVSQMTQPGSYFVPGSFGMRLAGLTFDESLRLTREEYCARILAGICNAGLKHSDHENSLLVNYNQLPEGVYDGIADHFGVSFSSDDLETMRAKASFNAKTPQFTFAPDADLKRREATDNLRRAAEEWLYPIYEQLEARRLK